MRLKNWIIAVLTLLAALVVGCNDRVYEYPSGYRVTLFLMGGVFGDLSSDRVHGGIMQPTAMKDVPRLIPNEPFLRMESPFAVWNTDPYGYGDDYTPDSIIDKHLTLYAIYGKYVYDEESLEQIECGNPDAVYVLSNNITIRGAWRPLCPLESTPFRGKLYGKGHTITFTGHPPVPNGGLFAYMSRANVADININANVKATATAGAVAGVMDRSTLNKVRATGTIFASGGAIGGEAGGLAGRMTNSRILYSSFGGHTVGQPTSKVSASGSTSYAGALAGRATDSEIQSCVSLSTVSIDNNSSGSNSSAAGGLVGYLRGGQLRDSFHAGQVTGVNGIRLMLGGIAGRVYEAEISSSMTQTIITAPEGSDSISGGIAGFVDNSNISNCVAGEVSVIGASAGRIAGKQERAGIYSNNYARSDMNVNYTITGDSNMNGTGIPHSNMRKSLLFYKNTLGWDFRLHWIYPDNYLYPRTKWEEEYLPTFTEIYTAEELASMEMYKWYILMRDIDLSEYNNGRWRALGGVDDSFSGLLDGNGHIIYNMSGGSLFGITNTLVVYDLELQNVSSTGGALASRSNTLTAERIKITGRIGNVDCGGLAGSVNIGMVSYCSFDGGAHEDTAGISDTSGGLIGQIQGGYVTYSYSAGVAGAYSTQESRAGGFVGRADNTTFINNYSIADVYSIGGRASYAGGFVGHLNNSRVINSYAYGNIYSSVRNQSGLIVSRAGGFVGEAGGASLIRNAAAFGENVKATYSDVTGTSSSFGSSFAAVPDTTAFANIYSNHAAVVTADTSGLAGANTGTVISESFFEQDLLLNFPLIWRMPAAHEIRRYPVFQWEKRHIHPLPGEEWYWFAVRKYYEEFQ